MIGTEWTTITSTKYFNNNMILLLSILFIIGVNEIKMLLLLLIKLNNL